jgi:hypothetical protein
MRWRRTNALLSATFVGSDRDLVEIPAREAAALLDRWWTAEHT